MCVIYVCVCIYITHIYVLSIYMHMYFYVYIYFMFIYNLFLHFYNSFKAEAYSIIHLSIKLSEILPLYIPI